MKIGPLHRYLGVLDALAETAAALPSPVPPEDAVPLLNRVRGVARAVVHEDVLDEERANMLVALLHPDFLSDKEMHSAAARASLALLRGYLRGCLNELSADAQIEANARAYGEAKIKEERGVGFKSP